MNETQFLMIWTVIFLANQMTDCAVVRKCSYGGKLYDAGDTIKDEVDSKAKLCTYITCNSLGIVVRHYIWNCREVSEKCGTLFVGFAYKMYSTTERRIKKYYAPSCNKVRKAIFSTQVKVKVI